ncbi:hypothetical protein MMC13_003451 [Lambiella insularis]|nr:hypothetical protein [Lambiella insularis]
MAIIDIEDQSSSAVATVPSSAMNGKPPTKSSNGDAAKPADVPKSRHKKKTSDAGTGSGSGAGANVNASATASGPVAQSGDKISGAEAKKRKKEEKIAKRAEEKQVKPQAVLPDLKAPRKVEPPAEVGRRGSAGSGPGTPVAKAHHKPTGSIQKSIPLRAAQPQTAAPVFQPKKDNKNVALFGHLYSQPRRTTVAAAGKDVHPAILALGLQMSNYVICGSNARCVATLLAFKRVIESYATPPQNSLPRHLTAHLSPQIEYLVSCRPMSVSMGNAVRWLKLEINDVDPDTEESKAKADLCEGIDNFVRERITVADQVISTSAAGKIQDGDVILTFAKSSIVQQTLVEAYRKGTQFRVIVVDSRPLFEGKHLARALADLGLEVQYSLTHAIDHVMKEATKVFLGAHAMMSNGRLFSRIGTAIVAMMAKESDVPVIVCCESIKFTDKVALDSIVTNEVAPPDELIIQGEPSTALKSWRESPNLQLLNLMYDVTPADYINMVVTEYGSLPPSSVPVVHRLSTNT